MPRYGLWSLKRAARVGYLAGRGMTAEEIFLDGAVGASSIRSIRMVAARWGISIAPQMQRPWPFPLSEQDIERLTDAAEKRGMQPNALAARILSVALGENLINAIIDEDDNGVGKLERAD